MYVPESVSEFRADCWKDEPLTLIYSPEFIVFTMAKGQDNFEMVIHALLYYSQFHHPLILS